MTSDSMTVSMFAHAHHGTNIEENPPMHMATKARPWTRADLERLPDDGNKYEVIRGELFVTPPPSTRHEELLTVLADHLRRYAERAEIGRVYAGKPAMVLDDSHAEPDLLIRRRVVPLPDKWDQMPVPILIVEILSSSTRRRDLIEKKALYLDAGVVEYWIVDGLERSVRVVRADGERVETNSLRWEPAGASDPFVLNVAAYFHEALG